MERDQSRLSTNERPLKLALFGYGKMGRLIESISKAAGHRIVSIIDPSFANKIDAHAVQDADVCIDFSTPSCILNNITTAARLGKTLVIGTTGWYEQIHKVEKIVKDNDIGLIYSPNFSIGVHLFLKSVKHAASLFLKSGHYEAAGMEAHHSQKVDAPSGTAIALTEVMSPYAHVPFSSIRCGSIPGTHTIYFDSPADTITLTHQARDRSGFARGAIDAAQWINKRKGLYTMEDFLACKV